MPSRIKIPRREKKPLDNWSKENAKKVLVSAKLPQPINWHIQYLVLPDCIIDKANIPVSHKTCKVYQWAIPSTDGGFRLLVLTDMWLSINHQTAEIQRYILQFFTLPVYLAQYNILS